MNDADIEGMTLSREEAFSVIGTNGILYISPIDTILQKDIWPIQHVVDLIYSAPEIRLCIEKQHTHGCGIKIFKDGSWIFIETNNLAYQILLCILRRGERIKPTP